MTLGLIRFSHPPDALMSPSRSIVGVARESIERSFRRRLCERDPLRASIALLTDAEIRSMSRADLLDTIRIAHRVGAENKPFLELSDLEQEDLLCLALLVRRRIRFKIDCEAQSLGYSSFFRELPEHRA